MKMLRITIEGKSYEVGVEVLGENISSVSPSAKVHAAVAPATPLQSKPPAEQSTPVAETANDCTVVACPMAGMVFKCLVKPGDSVTLNQVVVVLDAMKMETPVSAPVAGRVRAVLVKEGDAVSEGQSLLQIEGGTVWQTY